MRHLLIVFIGILIFRIFDLSFDMSKQLTLFGKRASVEAYFKDPKNDYERFVNRKWEETHEKFGRKHDFLQAVLKDWDSVKNDPSAVKKYLEHRPPPSKSIARSSFVNLISKSPVSTVLAKNVRTQSTSPPLQSTCTFPCQSTIANVPNDLSGRAQYLESHEHELIKTFMVEIGFNQQDSFFTDDILNDESLLKTLASLSYSWNTFSPLKKTYMAFSLRVRETNLKIRLEEIDSVCSELVGLLKQCTKLKTLHTMTASLISQTYLTKLEVIKNIVFKVGQLNMKVADKNILSDLRRRIKQQDGSKLTLTSRKPDELHACFCYNNTNLTWEEAFDNIIIMENSGITQDPLSTDQLRAIASITSENIVTMPEETGCVMTNDALHQILKLMPVMLLQTKTGAIFLNLHEFVYTPGAIEALLLCSDIHDDMDSDSELHDHSDLSETCTRPTTGDQSAKTTPGQPSICSKFPDLVNIAADFVKQHGFAAQSRRRTGTGSSSGVSVAQIREHLLDKVPGLREHGISTSTTRRLFHAPDKGNVASHRYKALIDARIGCKKNSYREYHPDSHYLFARNKQRREFCTMLDADSCILSMDDMAKIKVGAPAVSRYHQIRRIFHSSDMPNLNDHDFPVPNYLLSVSGYMFLEGASAEDDTNSLSETAYDTTRNSNENIEEVKLGEVADNLWSVLIEQCKTQLNVNVSEEDLKDVIANELKENGNIYRSKVDINNLADLFKNLSSANNLDVVTEAISSQFQCDIIRLKSNGAKEVLKGRHDSSSKQSPLYYGFKETDGRFYHVRFPEESIDTYKPSVTNLASKNLKHDGLGRLHLDTPYSGPTHLKIRSHKYNSTTAATHVTDLYNILKPCEDEKSIFMFLADGGPDFNPSHIANSLFYYRLFKKLDADILDVMTYAARYSAFNPIEHCWSLASNHLAGVVFSPLVDEDTAAPALQSGLDEEVRKQKEKVIFDRAMNAMASQHWYNLTFDDFPVNVQPVMVDEDNLLYDDYDRVRACLKCPLRSLHEYSDIVNEMKGMLRHIDRHLNEIIFIKCSDKSCCGEFRSQAAKDFLGEAMRLPSPSQSSVYKGRYNTFLQETMNTSKRFGDTGQPNAEKKALGSCPICPSFSFKSKTEKDRHHSMFHRRQKLRSKEVQRIYCSFEGCGKSFGSQPSLSRHQTKVNHRARDKPKATNKSRISKPGKASQSSISDMLRQLKSKELQEGKEGDKPCALAECDVASLVGNRFRWIQCDECDEWYHDHCVELQHHMDDALAELTFVCKQCESMD